VVIEGVSNCCYQPTLDDVGFKICVHAIPASDAEEYEGMPMFKESEVLLLDPQMEQQSLNLVSDSEDSADRFLPHLLFLNQTKCSCHFLDHALQLVQKKKLSPDVTLKEVQYDQIKELRFVVTVNNLVEIEVGEGTMEMGFQSNHTRDLFVLTVRKLREA